MNPQSQFREFNKKIALHRKSSSLKEVQEKRNSIDSAIKAKIKEKEWGDAKTFLQGSYASDMAIVPLDGDYDIDVAVSIPSASAPDSPIPVKVAIEKILEDRGLSERKIKKPCVTAQYMKDGEPKFHIDYPVYSVDENDNYKLGWGKPNSPAEDKKWSSGDPIGLNEWIDSSDMDKDEREQYKCLVRYLKRWRDLRYSTSEAIPFSIGITIMVRECYVPSFTSDGDADDLDSLIKTIEKITSHGYFVPQANDKYNLIVSLPKSPYVDVFKDKGTDMGTKLYNRLNQLKKRLESAQAKTTLIAACKILAEDNVFGSDFPVPDNNGGGKNSSTKTITGGAVGSPQGA